MRRPLPRNSRRSWPAFYVALESRHLMAGLQAEPQLLNELDLTKSVGDSLKPRGEFVDATSNSHSGWIRNIWSEHDSVDRFSGFGLRTESSESMQRAGEFCFDISADMAQQVRFRLVIGDLEAPVFSLINEQGEVVQSVSSSQATPGSELELTIAPSGTTQRVLLRVECGGESTSANYELVTELLVDGAVSDTLVIAVRPDQSEQSQQLEPSRGDGAPRIVLGPEQGNSGQQIADESSKGEAKAKADEHAVTVLDLGGGFDAFAKVLQRGSLLSAGERDLFLVKLGEAGGGKVQTLNLSLRIPQANSGQYRLRILNASMKELSVASFEAGSTQLAVQLPGVATRESYYVEVSAEGERLQETVNYELTASRSPEQLPAEFRSQGQVGNGLRREQNWQLAEASMMQFDFGMAGGPASPEAMLWATIYNSSGQPVYQSAARPGEQSKRTAVYLTAGAYRVEIRSSAPSLSGLSYSLVGRADAAQQGPAFIDPSRQPFDRRPNEQVIYPGDEVTDAVFLFADFSGRGEPIEPPPPPLP